MRRGRGRGQGAVWGNRREMGPRRTSVQQSAFEHAALIWTRPSNTIRARGTTNWRACNSALKQRGSLQIRCLATHACMRERVV